jgi:hypothetical protein
MNERTKLFISYSHEDLRWLNEVKGHLAVLEREGLLDAFEDTKLQAGDDWYARLHEEMSSAKVGLLLISAPFLGSGFIRHEEVPRLFEQHAQGGMLLYPLLVRPCPWQQVAWLSALQLRPQDSKRRPKAVSAHSGAARDQVLADVAIEIAHMVQSQRKKGSREPKRSAPGRPAAVRLSGLTAAPNDRAEAVRLRVEAESEDLIARWPVDEGMSEKLRSIIEDTYGPRAAIYNALDVRIEGQLIPVLEGLAKIESDLRSRHGVPFDDTAVSALRDRLRAQILRTWESLVTCALLDAERHVIKNLGEYPGYKEKELSEIAAEEKRSDRSVRCRDLFTYVENLIKKARADSVLNNVGQ